MTCCHFSRMVIIPNLKSAVGRVNVKGKRFSRVVRSSKIIIFFIVYDDCLNYWRKITKFAVNIIR